VKQQLLTEGVELEEFGGTVQAVETAATAGTGLRELEEALLLQARQCDADNRFGPHDRLMHPMIVSGLAYTDRVVADFLP